VSVD
jgi:hypothetical protein